MSPLFKELQTSPAFAAYLLIGVVVALVHMRRERMMNSATQDRGQMFFGVTLMLTIMWPVLLFAMLLNLLQRKPEGKTTSTDTPDEHAG